MSDIRKYVELIESIYNDKEYNFVGTCVNSFDEDTMDYMVGTQISDINDLAFIDEEYVNEDYHDPELIKKLDGGIPTLDMKRDLVIKVPDRTLIVIYKDDEDVHYFYEK